MMSGMRAVCVGVIVAAAACSATATVHAQTAVGTLLGEDGAGYPHAFVVMDNGDVFRSDFGPRSTGGYPQLPWYSVCNIFSAGGGTDRVVGLGGGVVLTAGGGVYRLATSGPCAIFDGVIDHPAGESFVTIGSNVAINGCHIYAVTDNGHVYRAWIGCGGGGWEDAGSLPLGPTSAVRRTWGSLKLMYR